MLKTVRRAMNFMTRLERLKFLTLLGLRASVSFIDLLSIVAIGVLATSAALFVTQGSESIRDVEIAGISLGAVESDSVPTITAFVLFLFLLKAIVSIELTRRLASFLARIEARASRDIARAAFGKGLDGVRNYSRDEVLFAALSGSPSAFNALLNSLGNLAAEGFLFVIVIISFTIISPIAALASIVFFLLIGIVIQFFIGRELEKTSIRVNDQAVVSSRSLLDLSEVFKEATVLGRQNFFIDKLYKSRLSSTKGIAYQIVLGGMPRYIVETSLIFGLALFIVIQLVIGDLVSSAATIGIFLTGGLRLTAALLPFQSALLTIKQSTPAANRALNLLEQLNQTEPAVQAALSPYTKEGGVSVSLRDVSFVYPEGANPAIKNVSIQIPPGAQTAFIGLSGAGKSTLADLILGLLNPSAGEILLDGKHPSDLIHQNPGLLGYVPQKPGMVSGTIADNILLGIEPSQVNSDRLMQAISDANLSEFIKSLPEGVWTEIGKQKDQFSGGQLQRIGLARALYSNPKLLVMDEATSALDAESENEINKCLDNMRGKVTVILIAHRLNTVQRSDVVHLLSGGSLEATGTFPQLLRTNQTVQTLASLMALDATSQDD